MKINVYGMKGGVGVTTVACLISSRFANDGKTVSLVGNMDEFYALTGGDFRDEKYDNITIVEKTDEAKAEIVIADGNDQLTDWADVNILVVTNTYMALRASVDAKKSFVVAFVRENLALLANDVRMVLNAPTTIIDDTPENGRSIDAGLWFRYLDKVSTDELIEFIGDAMLEVSA